MDLEYYVRLNEKSARKTGFLSSFYEGLFTGKLEKTGEDGKPVKELNELYAEMGVMNGRRFLHIGEKVDSGCRFKLYWLHQVGNSQQGSEEVYFGHCNEENVPHFSINNMKTIFMENPRFKNGTAEVMLSKLDYQ